MDLTLVDFVLLVLSASAALVVVSAVVSRTLRARAESRALDRRVICRLCLHAFETTETGRTVDCPACGVANERKNGRRWG